jgi:hypothetical protein
VCNLMLAWCLLLCVVMEQHKRNIGNDSAVSCDGDQEGTVAPLIPTKDEAMMIAIGRAFNPAFDEQSFMRTARRLVFEHQPPHQSGQVH